MFDQSSCVVWANVCALFYKAFANVEICLHLEVQVAVLSVLIF